MWLKPGTAQVGAAVPGTKSPSQQLWALLSQARAAGGPGSTTTHPMQQWGKRWSELKQQCVSNPMNVIIHCLITEMVSHCSGGLGETDRAEPGFCQALINTRDGVLMDGSSILSDKAGSFQVWNPVLRQNSFLLLHWHGTGWASFV